MHKSPGRKELGVLGIHLGKAQSKGCDYSGLVKGRVVGDEIEEGAGEHV